MTQLERMRAGLIYDPMDPEILALQFPFLDLLRSYNELTSKDADKRQQYLKTFFAECGEDCYLEPPFYANWGGHHVHLGNRVYANFNLTLVDDGQIFIDDGVMIGPNVTIATANHPILPALREKGFQYNRDVHIEKNVWIGAGTVIVPGVTVGENSVIGAGSVVTKNIPANVVAVGNPCRAMREIGERDQMYFYREQTIDWENL